MRPSDYLKGRVGDADVVTSLVVPDTDGRMCVCAKDDAVIAGMDFVVDMLESAWVDVSALVKDGDRVSAGTRVISASGPMRLLTSVGEIVTDVLSHMSTIATATSEAVKEADGRCIIAAGHASGLGTEDLDRKAIEIGGGDPNTTVSGPLLVLRPVHVRACGNLRTAMEKLSKASFTYMTGVEVSTPEEVSVAVDMGADVIVASGADRGLVEEARRVIDGADRRVALEVECADTEGISAYADIADVVSVGSLTEGGRSVRFGIELN
ncbi:MAG: hypothetical protein IJ856_00730 [Candidatus Methanomethylophilaceae archaeon]|nr:hypothetical protein [Candidatus Methanomethylophilaceae archaeon]